MDTFKFKNSDETLVTKEWCEGIGLVQKDMWDAGEEAEHGNDHGIMIHNKNNVVKGDFGRDGIVYVRHFGSRYATLEEYKRFMGWLEPILKELG
jgi:hypothetical protein